MATLTDTLVNGNLRVNGRIELTGTDILLESLFASPDSDTKLSASHGHGNLMHDGSLLYSALQTGYVIAIAGKDGGAGPYYLGRSAIEFYSVDSDRDHYALSNDGTWKKYQYPNEPVEPSKIEWTGTSTSTSDGTIAVFQQGTLGRTSISARYDASDKKYLLECNVFGSAASSEYAEHSKFVGAFPWSNAGNIHQSNFSNIYSYLVGKGGKGNIWFNYRTIGKDATDPTIDGTTKSDITDLRYIFGHFTGDMPTGSTLVANYFTGTAADTSRLVATLTAGTTGYYIVVDPDHRALHTDPNTIYFI